MSSCVYAVIHRTLKEKQDFCDENVS